MSKAPKTEPTEPHLNNAVDAIVGLTELALRFHGETKPTLSAVAKMTNRASRLLRIEDADARTSYENAAVMALAKRLNLLGTAG